MCIYASMCESVQSCFCKHTIALVIVGWGVRVHVCGGQEEQQFQDAELAGVGIKARYEIVKLVKPCGFIFVGFPDFSAVYQSCTLVCYLRRTL